MTNMNLTVCIDCDNLIDTVDLSLINKNMKQVARLNDTYTRLMTP
jgi:hypothetical protein